MAKWEKRFKEILSSERKKHYAVWELADNLEKIIHGFSPISREELKKEITPIIDSTELVESVISEIKYENRYEKSDCEENNMILTINITGDFKGSIVIKTGRGTRDNGTERTPIFYVSSYDKNVYSNKISEMKRMYKKYHNYSLEVIIDLFFDRQSYLSYDDRFKVYEISNKKPSSYDDSIKGYIKSYDDKKD
ncbi:hypothetical protein FJQ98_16390 [Lysinibacillus agricola]|uniref:Uncharacterized protein n=1 Tax=Lysinibacillus agricola TaxID=2590012 RepID=A0ABX7ALW2_9BACI|nr:MULTISPECIES: hypothetical protein [Lysinibacillus]KOS61488.1 hypothetical protein AN161_18020 [Lysinibacillus sp. FJAT-14222]QQP10824.1 hypothetical protein FJQ98_16390 [Lysinibacillus agricola]